MSSYKSISAKIDRMLLRQEIENHLKQKRSNRDRKKSKSDRNKTFPSKPKKHVQESIRKTNKVETITIPSSANKIVITLEG